MNATVTHTLSHLVNAMRFHMNYTEVVPQLNGGPSKRGTTLTWFLAEGRCLLSVNRLCTY